MKTIISILLISLLLTGCAKQKEIDSITYDTYGLLNKDELCSPDIQYEVVIGNVIWSVILMETVIAPIYFIGFSLYEPVGKKINYYHNPKENND